MLHRVHLRLGVIQYFDVGGLRHIVVKEPQVFFNRVTDVIISLAICSQLKSSEILKKVSIITASVFKNVVSSDDKITCQEFLKLLVHLRIVTQVI